MRLLNFLRLAYKEWKIDSRIIRCYRATKTMVIIKIPGHSKAAIMEAKENHLVDAAAKQAALNNQIVQTQECSLFPLKPIKDSLLQFQRIATEEEKKIWKQKGGTFDPDK